MERKIIVETSARHVHVSREDLDVLFGKGYELCPKKALSQPGQFACEERVDLVGPKKELKSISILGPARVATQVEISMTDARTVGIAAPVRESGDVAGSPGCILRGPAGEVELKEGVIVAKRHIHMTPEDAEKFGLEDKEIVGVRCGANNRELIFHDVVLRVSDKFATAMHLDTDEANAAGAPAEGFIIKLD